MVGRCTASGWLDRSGDGLVVTVHSPPGGGGAQAGLGLLAGAGCREPESWAAFLHVDALCCMYPDVVVA